MNISTKLFQRHRLGGLIMAGCLSGMMGTASAASIDVLNTINSRLPCPFAALLKGSINSGSGINVASTSQLESALCVVTSPPQATPPFTLSSVVADPYASLAAPIITTSMTATPACGINTKTQPLAITDKNAASCRTIPNSGNLNNPTFFPQGITINSKSANVTLQPGLYIVGGVGFNILNGKITGNGVTIYVMPKLTNMGIQLGFPLNGGFINIVGQQNVNLAAPISGPYSGVVLFQDRNNQNLVNILSAQNVTLSGALYAPSASLNIVLTSATNGFQYSDPDGLLANKVDILGVGNVNAVATFDFVAFLRRHILPSAVPMTVTSRNTTATSTTCNLSGSQSIDCFDPDTGDPAGTGTLIYSYGITVSSNTIVAADGTTGTVSGGYGVSNSCPGGTVSAGNTFGETNVTPAQLASGCIVGTVIPVPVVPN